MKRDCLDIKKGNLVLFILFFLIGIIVFILGLHFFNALPQKYNDFIVELLSASNYNKSIELTLFWITTIVSLIIMSPFLLRNIKNNCNETKEINEYDKVQLILSIINVIYFMITGNILFLFFLVELYLYFLKLLDLKNVKTNIVLFILSFFIICSLLNLFNLFGICLELNSVIIYIINFIVSLIICIIGYKYNVVNKMILLLQVPIPTLFFVYLINRYNYKNEIIYVSQPMLYKFLIFSAFILFTSLIIINLIKKYKCANKYDVLELISLSTCIVIFAFNCIDPTQHMYALIETHHTPENMMGFRQVFNLKMNLYSNYSPVSGLFTVVIGFFMNLIGPFMTHYYMAEIIFKFFVFIITCILLNKHTNKYNLLIISCCFAISNYNRPFLILPSFLILYLPSILKNKDLWLKIWILLVFLNGLYYPTYGVALMIGTIPFGIYNIYHYIKDGDLKKNIKKPAFYISWIIIFTVILLFIPTLINMAKNILLYSAQTLLADGVALYNSDVNPTFLPYLAGHITLRKYLFYAFRMILPASVIYLLYILIMENIDVKEKKIKIKDINLLFLFISQILFLLVSYSSTLVRTENALYMSRSAAIIVPVICIVLFCVATKKIRSHFSQVFILSYIVLLAIIVDFSNVNSIDKKLLYSYKVDADTMIYVSDEMKNSVPLLGNGFVNSANYNKLISYKKTIDFLKNYDDNLYFVCLDELEYYYLLDLKALGQPSTYAIKDYNTSKYMIDIINKYKPVVGSYFYTTMTNYYLYYYMMTNDDYVYVENLDIFITRELYSKIYGHNPTDTNKNKVMDTTTWMGRNANSLGRSLDSLKKILRNNNVYYEFEKVVNNDNITFNITFDSLSGKTNDILYLEFNDLSSYGGHLKLYFDNNVDDQNYIDCEINDGKLLIMMGSNKQWLLNNHISLKLEVTNLNDSVDIKTIDFYSLKHD